MRAFAIAAVGTLLGFALLLAAIFFEERLGQWYTKLRAAIKEAREGKKLSAREIAERKKRIREGKESFDVLLPAAAGPLVETPVSKDPLPLKAVPIRSTKADAKREAHRYAERRAGRPLTWKAARQLMNKWEREERMEGAKS